MADNPEPPLSKRPRLSAEGEVEGSEQMRGGSGGVGELQEETEAKRDAYYLANFKSILSSVLTDSHVTTKMDHVTNDGHVTTELDHVTNDYCPCAPHTIDHDNVISEGHVIGKSVRSIVDRFTRLAEPQQQLYVRLFLRKRQWLRSEKLVYSDIATDLSPVVAALKAAGFLDDASNLSSPPTLLSLLMSGELKTLCKEMGLSSAAIAGQKTKVADTLLRHCRQHRPLFGKPPLVETLCKKARIVLGDCVQVAWEPDQAFSKVILLFSLTSMWAFGDDESSNASQIIYQMLRENIGQLVYADYTINVTTPIFSSEEEFERFFSAVRDEQLLTPAIEEKNVSCMEEVMSRARAGLASEVASVSSTKRPFLLRFTAGWVFARMLGSCVDLLEKCGRYAEACDVLETSLLAQGVFRCASRGRWWGRLALNYGHHLKRPAKMAERLCISVEAMVNQCLQTILIALEDPDVQTHTRLALTQRAQKICQSSLPRTLSLSSSSSDKGRSPKKSSTQRQSATKKATKKTGLEAISGYSVSDFPSVDIIPAKEICIAGKLYRNAEGKSYQTLFVIPSRSSTHPNSDHTLFSSGSTHSNSDHDPSNSSPAHSNTDHSPSNSSPTHSSIDHTPSNPSSNTDHIPSNPSPAHSSSVHNSSNTLDDSSTSPTPSPAHSSIDYTPSNSGPTHSTTPFCLVHVEGFAMSHYCREEGWSRALHAEGGTFLALFFLLMWDDVFCDGVADVFRTPYQTAPLDLYSECFYQSRRKRITEKLEWIESASPEALCTAVESTWTTNYGRACAGLNWELLASAEDAEDLASCMGGALLAHVCREFARDFCHVTSGLPDLTLWNPARRTCKFVEVKGPGDRLSHKQVVWLSKLAEWGCDVEVCRVKASNSEQR